MTEDLDSSLASLLEKRSYVSIHRDERLAKPPLGGVIEGVGESLVLVQEVRDFHRRGFVLIRRGDITAVVDGDVERLFERMLTNEGVRAELSAPPSLDLDDLGASLRGLKRMHPAITVECEAAQPPLFLLGRVTKVTREAVSLRYITVEGILEKDAIEVPLDDVTLVGFDDRYSAFFGRHAIEEGHH